MKKIVEQGEVRSQAVEKNEMLDAENKENVMKEKRQRRTGDSDDEDWKPEPKNNSKVGLPVACSNLFFFFL